MKHPGAQSCEADPTGYHYWAFRLDNGELRDAPGVGVSVYQTRVLDREGEPALLQADLPTP